MSTSASLLGVSYTLPTTGDTGWGTDLTAYLVAIATSMLQKSGGSFTLTADVDFGATYGLKTAYYTTKTASAASAGVLRLARADVVGWRNQAGSANLSLGVDSSNNLTWETVPVVTTTGAQTLTNKTLTSAVLTSPEMTTPDLGVAVATSINKVAITAPAVSAALSLANGSTLATSGAYSITLFATANSSVYLPTSGTLASLTGTETLTSKTLGSPTVTGTLLLQNTSGAQPELHLSEDPDNGTSKVILKAPAALAGDITFTLPDNDGGANEVLTTDGSGVLSWAAVATTVTTTRGDLIARGASADDRLAIGTAGKRLKSDGTDPVWGWNGYYTATGAGPSYTILDDDGYDGFLSNNSSGTTTFTLPAAANNSGRRIFFKNLVARTLAISGTIDGGTTNNSILAQNGYAVVFSDGTSWYWETDIQEAGSWTPVVTAATPGTESNGTNTGRYTRNGRVVTLSGESQYTKGTASGAVTITGIPFANRTGNAVALSGGILNYSAAPANRRDDLFWMTSGSSQLLVYWKGGTTGTNYVATAAADLGTTAAFLVGGTYHIT